MVGIAVEAFTSCGDLNEKCLQQVHVFERFVPCLAVLFGEVMGPLEGGALLRKCVTEVGFEGFYPPQDSLLYVYLSPSPASLLPECRWRCSLGFTASDACRLPSAATMNSPSRTLQQSKLSFLHHSQPRCFITDTEE